jgi:hypothetical protein
MPAKPRRAALLCCHFTRNLAYYRAGWEDGQLILIPNEFWKTANSNFLDIAVLEWCKLYADKKAYHSYRKVVTDPRNFLPQMYSDYGATERLWAVYKKEMKTYRDKFIAHLDNRNIMHIPEMNFAQYSINYIYDTIICEQDEDVLRGLPRNLNEYSDNCNSEAKEFYHFLDE